MITCCCQSNDDIAEMSKSVVDVTYPFLPRQGTGARRNGIMCVITPKE